MIAAAVLAAAAGFGAAVLTRDSSAAATGRLTDAHVTATHFAPPAIGTTSIPPLRVVRHHTRAKTKEPVRPRTPVTQTNPQPTPTPRTTPHYTPPAITQPRTTTPPPKSKPRDSIGPTEGGGNG